MIIYWPREDFSSSNINNYDILLLNPNDPGWSSNGSTQREILKAAKNQNWSCRSWDNELYLCKKSQDICALFYY